MHFSAAFMTAFVVTVAPETASISALCAFISAALRSSAMTCPIDGVSPARSSTTSVMAVSLKVIVTLTVLMPCAVAVYVPGV